MRPVNQYDEASHLTPQRTLADMDGFMGFGTLMDDGRSSADIEVQEAEVMVTNPAMRAHASFGPAVRHEDAAMIDAGKADVLVRSGNQDGDAVDPRASKFIWGYLGTNDAPVVEQPTVNMETIKQANPFKKIPMPVLVGTGILLFLMTRK